MNRVIKFRAWDNREQKLYPPVELNVMMNTGEKWDLDELDWLQCTGLKDKNGVEIYEGDILKTIYHNHEVVFGWGEDNEGYMWSYGWCLRDLERNTPAIDATQIVGSSPEDYNDDWEVIGNRYENPELLESSQTRAA